MARLYKEADFKAFIDRRYPHQNQREGVWRDYVTMLQAAKQAAAHLWDGTIREGPYIAGLPGREMDDDGHLLIAWKQDWQGFTFVASPWPLPWLEAMAVNSAVRPKGSTKLAQPAAEPTQPAKPKKPRR